MTGRFHNTLLALILLIGATSCKPVASTPQAQPSATAASTTLPPALAPTLTFTPAPTSTPTATVALPTATLFIPHSLVPSKDVKMGKLIHDAVSVDTAVEKRAPYGDSYDINLFERPFLQDMTYVADLDIASYNLGKDEKFYYVSIELVGTNPNNPLGINYAVELDLDADGFGDLAIAAHPPYTSEWTTVNVQVAQDTNHDTAGLSAEKSDAPIPGDGYDTVIFDGGRGIGADPDLAWVRVNAGNKATVQFAFRLSLAENRFMLNVLADAGIRDVGELDFADRFTKEQAGSPQTGEQYYPLKMLFGVDNVCRQAYGFEGTGEEPRRCPPA